MKNLLFYSKCYICALHCSVYESRLVCHPTTRTHRIPVPLIDRHNNLLSVFRSLEV